MLVVKGVARTLLRVVRLWHRYQGRAALVPDPCANRRLSCWAVVLCTESTHILKGNHEWQKAFGVGRGFGSVVVAAG